MKLLFATMAWDDYFLPAFSLSLTLLTFVQLEPLFSLLHALFLLFVCAPAGIVGWPNIISSSVVTDPSFLSFSHSNFIILHG
jgi:hypothetical protein